MDSTPATATKQKKGIKKLWAKIKVSMRSGDFKSQPSTTTTASAPEQSTPAPPPTSSTAVTEPAAQPEPASMQQPEPTIKPPTQAASAPAQTIQPSKETTGVAKARDHLPGMADVIEVDEHEDEDESCVDPASQWHSANFSSIQIPQKYLSTGSADDKIRFERAQAIFQNYNITLDPADWHAPSKSNVQRVQKKKRQRVHWTCHQCSSTFGREKICPQCSHNRCSTCVRYPPKKVGEEAHKRSKNMGSPVSATVAGVPTTGACHECKTEFTIGAPACGNCNHQICERCLKETIIASPATAPPGAQTVTVAAAS